MAVLQAMRLIGLTGGIACGKSTCAALLSELGFPTIDCDLIAREAVKKGTWGYSRVATTFGSSILLRDGEINREALGNLVFADPDARRKLNAATHLPVLARLLLKLLQHWLSCTPAVVVDMPLLFETGFHRATHLTVLVACSELVQRRRLMERNDMEQDAADSRIASQMSLDLKRQLASIVIENDGDLEELQETVRLSSSEHHMHGKQQIR